LKKKKNAYWSIPRKKRRVPAQPKKVSERRRAKERSEKKLQGGSSEKEVQKWVKCQI